jgi:hypothetical protein
MMERRKVYLAAQYAHDRIRERLTHANAKEQGS